MASSSSSSSRESSNSNSHSRNRRPPNVILLRRALRLVHCLQKERGASGAYCAALAAASSLVTPTRLQDQLPAVGRGEDSFPPRDAATTTTALGQCTQQQTLRVGTLDAMDSARQNTDAAILLFHSLANDTTQQQQQQHRRHREPLPIPVSATLQKVRALLPSPKSQIRLTTTTTTTTSSDRVGFHRILVCFNTLIATVIHECILRHTSHPVLYPPRRTNSALSGSSSFSSFSVLQHQQQQQPMARASSIGPFPVSGGGGGLSSSHLIPPRVMPTLTTKRNLRSIRSDRPVHPCSDPSRMEYFFQEVSSPPETLVPITGGGGGGDCKPPESSSSSSSNHHHDNNNSSDSPWSLLQAQPPLPRDVSESSKEQPAIIPPWMELLQLLDCFTRLKESTGMERAMLCSILAAGQVDSVWLNDLIVQVENQRKLVEELNDLCGIQQQQLLPTPPPPHQLQQQQLQQHQPLFHQVNNKTSSHHLQSLQHLVQDVVHMNPNLQALQNKILTDCNLEGLNYQQPNGLWDLLSTYIDKLHSLELLIMEELEYCLPPPPSETSVVTTTATNSTTSPSASQQGSSTGASSMEQPCISTPLVLLPATNGSPTLAASTSLSLEATTTTATVTASAPCTLQGHDHSSVALEQLFFADSPLAGDVMHHIQAMSADQVKAKLLELLDNNRHALQQPLEPSTEHANKDDDDDTLHKHAKNNHQHHQEKQQPAPSAKPHPHEVERHDSILDPLDPWNTAASSITSKEWEINLYEITFQKRIGRGASGTTYQAKWSGQRVAVKVASITEMGLEGWRTEVKALQKLHHPNIIRLLGSVCNPSPLTYCLVLEYCSAGDLAWALQQSTPRQFFWAIASGMAHGVAYLHSRDIIHRDIKPSNVLLDGDLASGHFVVKVSDFGVATTQAFNREDRTAETGTYRWMAPEVIRHEAYSHMADVYSYALVLWQLLTRENPFATVSPISAAGKVALEGARPPFPFGTPRAVQELIQTCWEEVPEHRLPFDRISEILASELMPVLTPEETVWLESSHGHAVYARGLHNAVESHRPAAPVPQPPVLPPSPQPSAPKDNPHHHHHHQVNHQQQHNNNNLDPPPQQQPVDKRGSFRRIFPKLARS